MAGTGLILGPVVFDGFEVASGVSFGGGQRLVVHDLPGGRRVVDALGRQDMTIGFRGFFSGSDATLRARLVDELRASGALLPLIWDVFFYSVVVRSFVADYQCGWWIPFRLECLVVRDEASALIETAVDLGASVVADLGAAAAQALPLVPSIGAAQAAASQSGAAVAGTGAYLAASAGVAQAQGALTASVGTAEGAIDPATLFGGGSAGAGIASLGAMGAATGSLAALVTASGYAGRAARNLGNAST
ncbi:hypothetical protein [Acidisphaera rubrifaciens]|uniref:Phage protein n=1 Tax=Acidisphaera rubrifaciens HS-AP3 TaxID=1231350 RepID=A0A0D6P4T5_9PROT|nr:hypothetical protein [Acidisphaera rubrifaciens]GAN76356.1 hypothetical protein Asru_0086_32 [Acidisphaera rubrifaciens HS-AP3]